MRAWQEYETAKRRREQAEEWLGLPGKPSANGATFRLVAGPPALNLQMVGQHVAGYKMYHEIPSDRVAEALLSAIGQHWSLLRETVLAELKAEEHKALVAARPEVEAVMAALREADAVLQPEGEG